MRLVVLMIVTMMPGAMSAAVGFVAAGASGAAVGIGIVAAGWLLLFEPLMGPWADLGADSRYCAIVALVHFTVAALMVSVILAP